MTREGNWKLNVNQHEGSCNDQCAPAIALLNEAGNVRPCITSPKGRLYASVCERNIFWLISLVTWHHKISYRKTYCFYKPRHHVYSSHTKPGCVDAHDENKKGVFICQTGNLIIGFIFIMILKETLLFVSCGLFHYFQHENSVNVSIINIILKNPHLVITND